ncbi:MAG: 50S ribosomal protein L29 [Candidatus Phytoplasma stylosanthis]|uniref:50S ribosomal protein L29 n=1 Tax=Candidatus Phytoplasma stylosanthis TaxID=2798314 RepID=UPI00293B628F|nr:50S ribosomal protein L29 [Candidatus Phytoplasma stylosanthis]MDV3167846.1 50S ribosomal protein L29 [Candidatus Phytoplasma stylosanthis]MDV3170878.1 50S ribosomal protein L29 [Candidatus Phytoplasma stylosanthis]MDV3173496.1 50S ribosomal protein L29 [Candidatus Phytoplasma stylosanthis]MDV3174058.1 50S ribosomal protein L29 [Candidatus Phytoplasma stylosanthis]MDV3202430.1 50S ribosomal protein L29 [Candidatus Phytoplasma stylosanthis]
MRIKEIRLMKEEDINQKIIFYKKELFETKIKLDLAKSKDTSIVRKIKKNIARMQTVLNEKKREELI